MFIGISANYADNTYRIAQQYADCLTKAGVCAVILPITEDDNIIEQYMDNIHGLLLTGGGDMDPKFWGESPLPDSELTPILRDNYDLALYRAARRRCMPIMGICRGMQVMCIAEGGSLYQDIHQCFDAGAMNHSPKEAKNEYHHSIISKHTFFDNIKHVNSLHHQSINHLPEIFSLGAIAEDGVIEAFISDHYPMFGVQWHPEHLASKYSEHAALFSHFIELSCTYKAALDIHRKFSIIDTHTDTPMAWNDHTDMNQWQSDMRTDFRKMKSANMAAVFMVAYLKQLSIGSEEQTQAFESAKAILSRLGKQVEVSSIVKLAISPDEIGKNIKSGTPSVALGIENGYALNSDVANVELFHKMGVRYITLCHNGDNDICDSAAGNNTHNGLSQLGKEVIKEMNRLNIMVDISHASDQTMQQAIELSSTPVIASHSGARAICNHRRNIPDDILQLLANNGGVAQICLYDAFLNNDSSKASIDDIIAHIRHIINVAGIDHVGIGSDFDGGGGIKGCQSTNEYTNITMTLIENGFSPDEIGKIMGGNFLRVWQQQYNYIVNKI